MPYITIDQFLNKEQIKKAIQLRKAKDICKLIIEPNLKDINKKLGQENSATYLGYAVEYAINQSGVSEERMD